MKGEPSSAKMTLSEHRVTTSAKAEYIGLRWPITTTAEATAIAAKT